MAKLFSSMSNDQRRSYRMLKADLKASHTTKDWIEMVSLFQGRCCKCFKISALHKDHIIPVSEGGSNGIENIQPLCQSCNQVKSASNSTDYRSSLATYLGIELPIKYTKKNG